MKKTITANIGGINFHLDEDAFQRFSNYLDSIRTSLKYTEGVEEIMQDIEGRIAEMLQEKRAGADRVVSMQDVEEVIGQMGKPEDFGGTGAGQESRPNDRSYTVGRKMFRDPDDKVLGGVCSGIAAYLSLDPVWIRLAFAILFFGFGTGFMLYLVLWLVIPKARTTSDRLRMRGEPINVVNIERNIREEMEDLEKRTKQGSKAVAPVINRVLEGLGEILKNVFMAIIKVIAFILMFVGLLVAFVLFAAIFGLITDAPWVDIPLDIRSFFTENRSYLMTLIGSSLVMGIPFLALGLFGLKQLLKSRLPKFTNWSLLSIWFVGLILLFFGLLEVLPGFKTESSIRKEINFVAPAGKIITIDSEDGISDEDASVGIVTIDGSVRVSRLVKLDIRPSADSSWHLVQKLNSYGENQEDAKKNAESISYGFSIVDSTLFMPGHFDFSENSLFRGQHMEVILLAPEGARFRLGKGLKNMLYDVSNRQNIFDEDMVDRTWQIIDNELDCLDCNGSETIVN